MSACKQTGRSLQDILDSESSRVNFGKGGRGRGDRRERGRGRGDRRDRGNERRLGNEENYTLTGEKHVFKNSNLKENNSKSTVYISDMKQFPELNINLSQNSNNPSSIESNLNFKKVVDITNNNNNDNNDLVKGSHDIRPGWTVYNRKTNVAIRYDNYGNIVNTRLANFQNNVDQNNVHQNNVHQNNVDQNNVDQIYSTYEKMSQHWCEYYDTINLLVGDLSPYFNYKYDIQKLIEEDNELFENMYEYVETEISSDDENNLFDD